MERKHNKDLVHIGKVLRKNMTEEERHLWYDFLRKYPVKFLRQKVLGRYIVDFYCAKAKLIIELDGSQHYEKDGQIRDAERTAFFQQYDIEVIHIPNNEIKRHFKDVCEHIERLVLQRLKK